MVSNTQEHNIHNGFVGANQNKQDVSVVMIFPNFPLETVPIAYPLASVITKNRKIVNPYFNVERRVLSNFLLLSTIIIIIHWLFYIVILPPSKINIARNRFG